MTRVYTFYENFKTIETHYQSYELITFFNSNLDQTPNSFKMFVINAKIHQFKKFVAFFEQSLDTSRKKIIKSMENRKIEKKK